MRASDAEDFISNSDSAPLLNVGTGITFARGEVSAYYAVANGGARVPYTAAKITISRSTLKPDSGSVIRFADGAETFLSSKRPSVAAIFRLGRLRCSGSWGEPNENIGGTAHA
jgi:hypothetical protein